MILVAIHHSHDGVEATALSKLVEAILCIHIGVIDVVELLYVEQGVQLFLSFIVVIGVIGLMVFPFPNGLLELVGVDGVLEIGLFILIVFIQFIIFFPEGLTLPLPSAGELWLPQMSRKVCMAMILVEDQVESLFDSWERKCRADVNLDELFLFFCQSGPLQYHPADDLLREIDFVFCDLPEGLVEFGGVLQDRLILLALQLEEELVEVDRQLSSYAHCLSKCLRRMSRPISFSSSWKSRSSHWIQDGPSRTKRVLRTVSFFRFWSSSLRAYQIIRLRHSA